MPAYRLADFLPYQISYPAGTVSRVLGELMEARFGLNSAQWRVLGLLGSFAPLSTRDMVALGSTEKSVISRATTELVSRGLVVRDVDPHDKRLLTLHFSPAGQALYDDAWALALEFEAALLHGITEEQRAALLETLPRLRQAALDFAARMMPETADKDAL